MGSVHFISRRPQCKPCERCKCLVLTGIDEGAPYRTDIIPLNVNGEIAAWVTGRKTYGLHAGYVCHRNASRMKGDAKYGRPPVFANHACGKSFVEAIDLKHAQAVMKFVELITKHSQSQPTTEEEDSAAISIADLLSGKVIAIYDPVNDPAPF